MSLRTTKLTNNLCVKEILRSVYAGPHEETLDPQLPTERRAKTLIRNHCLTIKLFVFIHMGIDAHIIVMFLNMCKNCTVKQILCSERGIGNVLSFNSAISVKDV